MCFSHSKELFLECGGEGVVIFMHSLLSHKRPFFLLQAIFRNNNVLFHIFCSIFKSCKHQNMELVHFPSNLVPQITIFFFFYFKQILFTTFFQLQGKFGCFLICFTSVFTQVITFIVMTFLVRKCYGSPKKQEF